ncbi:MAG: FAD-dependent oxidoreductase [Oligoflexia bacterium]|nr:FAD-dependent oxidoreductase [Oligoflexia bacterium]
MYREANKETSNNPKTSALSASLITITVNGQEVQVPSDITILEAARRQGITIPTLCHNSRTKPFTSCFLCVVEVANSKSGLVPSCSAKVAPGMAIITDSEKIHKARKMALDLMLSDHAGDCVAPCSSSCPAQTDVQGYVAHIANGDPDAAVRLIKTRLALPVVCGTVCPNPCEHQCRRGLVDEPVAIRALKRFAAEHDLTSGPFLPTVASASGKKVAVVGGGPAGLAAAYYLRQDGHEVHLYEALPELGGMTRYGIPRFRLPWDKLDAEIKSITDLGVQVHTNKRLGRDFTIADLKHEGADAVVLAIGAHGSKSMGVENEKGPGVMGGVDFLRKVVLGEAVHAGKKVAVIGGGDVAMDCARVARRLGAEVTLLYRRSQEEMPALEHEQHQTHEEGVEFRFLTAPTAIIRDNDETKQARALRVVRMELGEPDSSGRRRPVQVPGSEEDLAFDLIISAIGQDPEISCLDSEGPESKPEVSKWKTIIYDPKTMRTSIEGVFTAGDCSFGPDTAVRALGEGFTAARAISLYFSGADIKFNSEYRISRGRVEELNSDDFAPRFAAQKRAEEMVHEAKKRLAAGGYAPISLAFPEAKATAEASRCIECGCQARYSCDLRKWATEYAADEKVFKGDKRHYDVDKRHPLIRFENDKCITCGNCVRLCREVREVSALTFVNRGFKTHIAPNFEDALQKTDCDSCGMCIDVCPTGTINSNTGKEEGPWADADETITTCTSCGRGCALVVQSIEGRIRKVSSLDGDPVNNACICAEGRFAYQLLGKHHKPISPKELQKRIKEARTLLEKEAKKKKLAVIVSPWLSLEDLMAAKELADSYNGTFYYLTTKEKSTANKSFPHAKLSGEANVAFLKALKAKALESSKVAQTISKQLIVSIGAYLPQNLGAAANVIAFTNFAISANKALKAKVSFPFADQLESKGSYLTTDDRIAFLNTKVPANELSVACLVSNICELPELSNIESIRAKIATMHPELKAIASEEEHKQRLQPCGFKTQVAKVAADAREVAFAAHYQQLFVAANKQLS